MERYLAFRYAQDKKGQTVPKKRLYPLVTALCCLSSHVCGEMHHHDVEQQKVFDNSYEWESALIAPFEELLISWNSPRPEKGNYSIYVSVDTGEWSPWLLYAKWGTTFQTAFKSDKTNQRVRVYQDTVESINGNKGKRFKIKVTAENGANLSTLKALHVCASNPTTFRSKETHYSRPSTCLNIAGLSQMALNDSRSHRLCSPTSTTAVLRFLNNDKSLNPIDFAESSWDSGFDIFGNWVFNISEAYNRLNNPSHLCWVERYDNFSRILDSLDKGFPTVISIRGPLPGSAEPYKSGHLLAVIGFDAKNQEVICMDPAFQKDKETIVRYKLNDLIQAWGRRQNIAYVFSESP